MRTHALSPHLFALLLLAACGGSQSGQTTTPNGSTVTTTEDGDAPPVDASRPDDAIAMLRTGPLGEVLTAFIPAGLPITAETLPLEELTGGETALAEHIDRTRGFQLLLGRRDVVAYSVGISGEIPGALLADGSRGELDRGAKWALRRSGADGQGSALYCIATPAADGNRLICGAEREAVVRAAPYMARTVAGTRVEGPMVRFEALLDTPMASEMRERLPTKLAEVIAQVESTLQTTTTGPLANPAVQREVLAFVRGIVDAFRSIVVDAREADFSLSVREGNYVLETRARYEQISSEWFGALMTALRTPAGWPTDLFARLPPDGVTYAIGTSDARDMAVIVNQIKALMDAFLGTTESLPAADRDALRAALDALFAPEVSVTATASNMGLNSWNAMLARTIEGPTPADRIARFRALRVALARRGIAPVLEALTVVSGRPLFLMREVRDMTARELPPGGYGIRFKIHAPAPLATDRDGVQASCGTEIECAMRAAAPATDQTYELVLAPMGTDFVVLFGRQTRTLWTAIQQSTGPGVTPGQPAMAEVILMPARMVARLSEQVGGPQMTINAGDAPIVMRIEPAGAGPGGLVDVDVSIPVAFVQAMVGMAMNGVGAGAAAPPATP